ncbi:MAG: hypothetical protein ACK5JD_17480 [Mangrovibacterium sp.]
MIIATSCIDSKEWGSKSHKVFGTTIHELAHAAHWNMDKNSYNNLVWDGYVSDAILNDQNPGDVRTLETWATTVEIIFALDRYKNKFSQPSYEYYYQNWQARTIAENNFYTSAGYDMIDNANQRSLYGLAYPSDRVNGYTVKQLEQALRGATSWNTWKNNIKGGSSNPTSVYLDELFSNW